MIRLLLAVGLVFISVMLMLSMSFRIATTSSSRYVASKNFLRLPLRSTSPMDTSSSSSNSSSSSSSKRAVDLDGDLATLLKDLSAVLRTPGLARAGISRSFQIARAFRTIVLDFSQSRDSFLDKSTGSISIPKVLRKVFEEFGATYIKLGQFVASSPTIFPPDYVEEFQACLDQSPTFPYSEIKRIIQADLKRPLSSMFASIDPKPLASASIAQVHRATLRDGTDVVIKVRKPGVDGTLKADLSFLFIASKLIEFINPSLSSFSLSNIVEDIRSSMLDELDFTKEIKNLENFRTFLEQNGLTEDATAPTPYPEFSGTRVLTMEYLDGVPLVDLESIQKFTKTPEATLVSALRTWALSVATNDMFHADVHAGNLLVLADGRVGFIDFGIVGKISSSFRTSILSVVDCFTLGDFEGAPLIIFRPKHTRFNSFLSHTTHTTSLMSFIRPKFTCLLIFLSQIIHLHRCC